MPCGSTRKPSPPSFPVHSGSILPFCLLFLPDGVALLERGDRGCIRKWVMAVARMHFKIAGGKKDLLMCTMVDATSR